MAIVKTFDLQGFINEFCDYGRKQDFSDQALEIIFDSLNDLGEAVEMDVLAICCEYTEQSCADILEFNSKWVNIDDDMNDEELVAAAREYLNDHTCILGEYVAYNGETIFVFASF